MHFEILVEDQSGKKALDTLIPMILSNSDTYKIIPYKGVGRIPKKLKVTTDASKRILLDNLPRLLKGYGKAWHNFNAVIIVVCDLDDKCLKSFREQLLNLLNSCDPHPETHFCIAIEEGEAWLLGDITAVKKAYPKAKINIIEAYRADSVCGTWELLADAVYPGGSQQLLKQGWQAVGAEKSAWAERITPHMDLTHNASPSFNYFLEKIQRLMTPQL